MQKYEKNVFSREQVKDSLKTDIFSRYTPIAFDERVTFWLQRTRLLPCACAFAALYACAIV